MRGITRAVVVTALAVTAAGGYGLRGGALSDGYHPAANSAAVTAAVPGAVPRIARHTARSPGATVSRPAPTVSRPARRPELAVSGKNAVSAIGRADPQAELGIDVVDRKSGATFGYHADAQFYSASLVKLLIAMDAIGGARAQPALNARVQRMLSYSDDAIASQLWVADGGPVIVSREIARMGLRGTVPPTDPGMWGATLLTAGDVARVYTYLLDDFPPGPRAVLMEALRRAAPNGADGFYQHFGIPDGLTGTPWAVKQGWMSYHSQVDLHTSGVVGAGDRYIVVILTRRPAGTPWDTARSAVTAGARALAPAVGG